VRCLFRGLGRIINEDLEDLHALIAGLLKRWAMGKSVSRDSSRTKEGEGGGRGRREDDHHDQMISGMQNPNKDLGASPLNSLNLA
jgi:hypothetical protein